MDWLYVTTSIAFGICSIKNSILWTEYWQKSNFNLPTLVRSLWLRDKRYSFLFSPFAIGKWALFACYTFVVFNESLTTYYDVIISAFFFFEYAFLVKDIYEEKIHLPHFRLKSRLILLAVISLLFILYFLPIVDNYLWLLLLDRFLPLFIGVFVFAASFPSEVYGDMLVQQAAEKIRKRHDIFTILIFGDERKAVQLHATKILSQKYSIVNARETVRSLQMIAEIILHRVTPDTTMLILSVENITGKDLRLLSSLFSINSIIFTASKSLRIDDITDILEGVSHHCLLIADRREEKVLQQVIKRSIVYYDSVDALSLPTSRNAVAIKSKNIVLGRKYCSFEVVCNDQHLMKLRLPFTDARECKYMLPGMYLALGLDISKNTIKHAYVPHEL